MVMERGGWKCSWPDRLVARESDRGDDDGGDGGERCCRRRAAAEREMRGGDAQSRCE